MRLQILVTQYEEPEELIRPLLASIGMQQGVDLGRDVEVLIGNDGSGVKLGADFLQGFPFPVRYLSFEHSGLPGTRAKLFEASSAEYVMFCDADDVFASALGLHTVFSYMRKGFDAFASAFYREQVDADGRRTYPVNEHDSTFVHGKAYRRQYLVDQRIVWHPELMYHEDFVFNAFAQRLTKNFAYCPVPFYMWKWRGDSLCRKDPQHVVKTYPLKIDATERLVLDFLERGKIQDAAYCANVGLFFCYFSMNMPEWYVPENAAYRERTRERMGAFYKRHEPLINSASPAQKVAAIRVTRKSLEKSGFLLEKVAFGDWLSSLMSKDGEKEGE